MTLPEPPDLDFEIDDADAVSPPVEHVALARTYHGFKPRDYQTAIFDAVYHHWQEGLKRLLVVASTGVGKTVVFSMVAQREVEQGGKVLILAHLDELLVQAAEKLFMVSGIEAAREKASEHADESDEVVVSSVQTLSRDERLQGWLPDHFSVIIVDEAHRSLNKSTRKILDHFNTARVLGVTATGERGDEKSLGEVYEKIAFDYGLIQAVRDGWLVRPMAKTVPLKVDMKGIKMKKGPGGNDFDAAEVAHRLEPFLDEIAAQLIMHAGDKKTLLFLPTVDTAITLTKKLRARGASADFVSGDRERCPDRHARIDRYRAGKIQFFACATLLIEGFDDPSTSCVCMLRPTKLRGLVVQAIGRGTRPLAGLVDGLNTPEERRATIAASRKPDMLILDFLWLTDRIDLATSAYIVTGSKAVAEQMMGKQGDLLDIKEQADRDLLESLAKEAKKHARKAGRTFDPLAAAVSIGDQQIASYKPKDAWESAPVTTEQAQKLTELKIDLLKIPNCGMAALILEKSEKRKNLGLASFGQLHFLRTLGYNTDALTTAKQAGWMIGNALKGGWKRG